MKWLNKWKKSVKKKQNLFYKKLNKKTSNCERKWSAKKQNTRNK